MALTDKWAALVSYLGVNPKIKYFKHRVYDEICDAVEDWKTDDFAPDIAMLNGLNDTDFMTAYEDNFHKTFQHEVCEALEHEDNMMESLGYDIMAHYAALKRYRLLQYPATKTMLLRR